MNENKRSPNKTWIFDIDGVVFPHNGYLHLSDTEWERALPGFREFFERIDGDDFIIFVTSRSVEYADLTYRSLLKNGIRHDLVIFGLPTGARILINDRKPDGKITAFSFNLERDNFISAIQNGELCKILEEG